MIKKNRLKRENVMKVFKDSHVGIYYAAGGMIAVAFLCALLMSLEEGKQTIITLRQDGTTIEGDGAVLRDNVVTIAQGGEYRITGELDDGRIYVDAGKEEEVELVLDGVSIANASDAAIFIEKAKQTTIVLAAGSENRLQCGAEDPASGAAEAASRAEEPVSGEADPAGGAEDPVSGEAEAASRAEEPVSGATDPASGLAGSGKDSDIGKTDGGTADSAVIYAKEDLTITGEGALYIKAFVNNGVQSKRRLCLDGGNVTIEALKHGMKGKNAVTVNGGEYTLAVGNKGIMSDLELTVTGGKINITESMEGLEANQVMIEGGYIKIMASDDGINANGGADKKRKHPSKDIVEDMPNLQIKGGEVYISAEGDGLDSNGNLLVEGGLVVIDGPVKDDDGPLDYGYENDGVCRISGGIVLAIGSAGMAETFDEESSQCSFRYIAKEPYEAGSEIVISGADGHEIYRHVAAKKGASVVFSAPSLVKGNVYILRIDGQDKEILLNTISETVLETVSE